MKKGGVEGAAPSEGGSQIPRFRWWSVSIWTGLQERSCWSQSLGMVFVKMTVDENKTEAAAGFFLFLPTTETQIFSVWFRPWSSSWVCTTHSTAVSVYFSHFLGLHSSVTIIVPNHGGRSTLTRIRPWPCGKCFYQTPGNANVSLEMLSVLSESLVRKHEPIRVNSTLRQHLHSVYDKLR